MYTDRYIYINIEEREIKREEKKEQEKSYWRIRYIMVEGSFRRGERRSTHFEGNVLNLNENLKGRKEIYI